jgi:dephospho-CoA kinase
MIIGLTGFCCSGKDTVAMYIVKVHGYRHYSLSSIIREIMNEQGIDPTRENMMFFGTQLRKKKGNDILVKKVLEKIDYNNNCCITSIRHSYEVRELKKRSDFVLVNICASQDVRFMRMKNRKRIGDPCTLEKFIELEKKESQVKGSGQQLAKTTNMADIVFVNNFSDMLSLETAIDNLLKDIFVS